VSARGEARLWVAQRATAVILAICVLVHLATIIYAVRSGLSAQAILARTQGSLGWGAFYGVFVVAAAVHGAIGLRTVASEWLAFRGPAADAAVLLAALALLVLGLRAVGAVVLA
jgi:fumarate reductase subunit C